MALALVLAITSLHQSPTAVAAPNDDEASGENTSSTVLIESQAFAPKTTPPGYQGPRFEALTPQVTGVDHVNPIDDEHPLRRVYHSSSACGGAVIGDIDLDGRPDLFLSSGPRANRLYLQRGEALHFEEVSTEAGIGGGDDAWGIGTALIDIDNDGDLDIYVCNYAYPNQLFVNQLLQPGSDERGEVVFKEEATKWRLNVVDGCVMPCFSDYDRDGDLDVYLLTHQLYRENGRPSEPIPITVDANGRRVPGGDWDLFYEIQKEDDENGNIRYTESGRPDYLLRNDGEVFVDASDEANISPGKHWGNSATWWDYNNDGWPDLYVGNDFVSPDFLYRNNGDGSFTEVAGAVLPHSTWFSMGGHAADFNNDRRVDFIIADMMPRNHYMQKASMGSMGSGIDEILKTPGPRQLMRNSFYVNTGTRRFLESAFASGVAFTEWTWAIKGQDFDNDGLNDMFFTNGIPRQFNHSDLPDINHDSLVGKTHWDHYAHTPERREQNLAFRNLGSLDFENVSKAWGLDHVGMSYGASTGDLDGDGDLDLVVSNLEDPLSIYCNHTSDAEGNSLTFRLIGRDSNTHGWGATIELESSAGGQIRQLFPCGTYLDGDQPLLHFGIGADAEARNVVIHWPSGRESRFATLAAGHAYTVTEPGDEAGPADKAPRSEAPAKPMFTQSLILQGKGARENEFDDYERQPLLPLGLSRLGPGQAWGDVDGDGDDDLYLGGSTDFAGQLFLNETRDGSPRLQTQLQAAFIIDAGHEDMGALFVDIDSDGDLDLYVASGSIEAEPGDAVFQDRLYLNDGNGVFSRGAANLLPTMTDSASSVTAADFDRDGDLDLFVGSRSVPGKYPTVPTSHLLRNDDGVLHEATSEVCAALGETGLVTGSTWTDCDGDGWMDLVVAHDWGPVKIYHNRGDGTLEDSTAASGLAELLAWWNGVTASDIDNDGDFDLVATSYGRNTQYQPTREAPELIYYGDFDGRGTFNIVEANFEHGTCFPRRGFSCSSRAMPSLGDKLQTYHNFALADLPTVYEPEKLDRSLRYEANTIESMWLENDGEGHFTAAPLPHLAQISPGYGICLTDVDGDGFKDLMMAQNFFSPQVETGPFDSGLSALLINRPEADTAENRFVAIEPRDSGILVPEDAMSLARVDLNGDRRSDFVFGINDGDPKIFLNASESSNPKLRPVQLRLQGKAGNPAAVGARVGITGAGVPQQNAEVSAGGGYLTQSSSSLDFVVPTGTESVTVTVRWPDGSETRSPLKPTADNGIITIEQP